MATPRDIARIRADPLTSFKVRSIISSTKLEVPIDIDGFHTAHSPYSTKKGKKDVHLEVRFPEFTHGAQASGKILVFRNGGIILEGFETVEDSKSAVKIAVSKMLPHVVLKSKTGAPKSKSKTGAPKSKVKSVPATTRTKVEAKRGRGRPKKNKAEEVD